MYNLLKRFNINISKTNVITQSDSERQKLCRKLKKTKQEICIGKAVNHRSKEHKPNQCKEISDINMIVSISVNMKIQILKTESIL